MVKETHTFHIINNHISRVRKDSYFYIVSFCHLSGKFSCQLIRNKVGSISMFMFILHKDFEIKIIPIRLSH